MNDTTCDDILYGRLKLLQPVNGPRVNLDTMLLADWVKVRSGRSRFLEAGCAAGAISLLLALRHRNFHITGLEIQPELIELARLNAKSNNLTGKTDFIKGDLRDPDILPREYFDGLVINPPYGSLEHGRASPDSSRSTARHELTCTPDDVAELASRVLRSRGRLFAIFTSERLDVFLSSMRSRKIYPKRLRPVYPYEGKNSGVFLVECIRNGGEGMSILPALVVRDCEGRYTHEVMKAYKIDGNL